MFQKKPASCRFFPEKSNLLWVGHQKTAPHDILKIVTSSDKNENTRDLRIQVAGAER